MSLRLKFAMLLGLAGSALLLALVVSVWSVVQLSQQIGRPFVGLASSMIERQEIDRCLDRVESALESLDSKAAAEAASEATQRAAQLSAMGWFDSGIGSRTADVLRDGLADLSRTIELIDWAGEGSSGEVHTEVQRMGDLIEMLRSLLQRLESRLLDDATLALAHADRLPQDLLVVVLTAAVLGTLILALGLVLLQRWMLAPVGRLRRAAERIGSGDFKHRIPIHGKDELATLSAEVNHMAETIERLLDERLDQERLAAIGGMVRRLAHNLRNPLAGIRGLAELTRAELPDHHEARAHQLRIIEAVDRFERWLSDLLNVSTPTAYRPGRHEPAEWLRGIVRVCEPSAERKGVRVEFSAEHCPPEADFDASQLEQALISIVSNAVEASPAGGTVTVVADRPDEAEGSGADSPGWIIRVTDEGPGIPEALREKVFGAYFTTKPDGKGIGLAVAQQIVHAHGGRIDVGAARPECSERQGAMFRIWLPLRDVTRSDTLPLGALSTAAAGPIVRV